MRIVDQVLTQRTKTDPVRSTPHAKRLKTRTADKRKVTKNERTADLVKANPRNVKPSARATYKASPIIMAAAVIDAQKTGRTKPNPTVANDNE